MAKLTKLYIKNFQSIKKPTVIELSRLVFLYGPNSAGKSAVYDATSVLLEVLKKGHDAVEDGLFSKDTSIGFELLLDEDEDLVDGELVRGGEEYPSIIARLFDDEELILADAVDYFRLFLEKLQGKRIQILFSYDKVALSVGDEWLFTLNDSDNLVDRDFGNDYHLPEGISLAKRHSVFGDWINRVHRTYWSKLSESIEFTAGRRRNRRSQKSILLSNVRRVEQKRAKWIYPEAENTWRARVLGFSTWDALNPDRGIQGASTFWIEDYLHQRHTPRGVSKAMREAEEAVDQWIYRQALGLKNVFDPILLYLIEKAKHELIIDLVSPDRTIPAFENWEDGLSTGCITDSSFRVESSNVSRVFHGRWEGPAAQFQYLTRDSIARRQVNYMLSRHMRGFEHLQLKTLVHKVNSPELGKFKIQELRVLDKGRLRRIHEVGSGLAYVAPVLGASTQRYPVFVQQPELHLHPRAQADLGDAFIDASGERVDTLILESHSEHLLLRVLRRVRESFKRKRMPKGLGIKSEDIRIYYFDPLDDGEANVIQMRISEQGEIVDRWPGGFFPERGEELF